MNIVNYFDRRYIERHLFKLEISENIDGYNYAVCLLCGAHFDKNLGDTNFAACLDTDIEIADFLKIPLSGYKQILQDCGGHWTIDSEICVFMNIHETARAIERLYCAWVMLNKVNLDEYS